MSDELADLATEVAGSPPPAVVAETEDMGVVVMRIGERWFGIPASSVSEVVVKEFITRIPLTPPHVLGLGLIHGRMVPCVALSGLLDIAVGRSGDMLPRLVVVSVGKAEIAIVADEARGVVDVPPPDAGREALEGDHKAFVRGEVEWRDHLLCILEPAALIEAAMGGQ